jgi:hypothetical protein
LESVCRGNSTVGSNPTLSATYRTVRGSAMHCLEIHLLELNLPRVKGCRNQETKFLAARSSALSMAAPAAPRMVLWPRAMNL